MVSVGRRTGSILLLGIMSCAASAAELKVLLQFQPQEAVASIELPSLPPSVLDKPISIEVIDERGNTSLRIGQGTDDDDRTFQILSDQPVAAFVQSIVDAVAAENGIRTSRTADRVLKVRLTRFDIDESNKALGSMYGGEVKFAYTLDRANGMRLMEGATEGSARRYGKSRSPENITEIFSDATKQAIASVFADPRLQESWRTGAAMVASTSADESVEARLARLDALLKAGTITAEEHKQARAEVLKDL